MIRKETFSANQAIQLLWVHLEDPSVNLGLTKEEVAHLKLEVIADWENLTSPYRKFLPSLDKLVILSIMANDENLFYSTVIR